MNLEDLIIFWVLYCLFFFIVGIVLYVFKSLGLFTIAKRRGIRNYGLAWVPVGDAWVMGAIADRDQTTRTGKPSRLRWWLLALGIATYVLLFIMLGALISLLAVLMTSLPYSDSWDYMLERELLTYGGSLLLVYLLTIACSIAYVVLYYICLYRLYRSCRPENATAYLVLSIFISVTMPFLLFACRKYDAPVWPAGGNPPYQPPYGQGYQPPYGQGYQPPYGQGYQPPYGQGYQPPYGQNDQPPREE